MEHTSEYQRAIQQPDVAKDPRFVFGIEKHTAWAIEEDIDSIVVLKRSTGVLKWVAPKHRCICTFICRAAQIEMRVLLEGDTCTVPVTAKIPKKFWKRRTATEFL